MIISTDIFSTKPLWFAIDNGEFALGSYVSSLHRHGFQNAEQIPANTTRLYTISTLELIEERTVWDLE